MKAKFINESIVDILKPKDKKEIEDAFREKTRMSWEKYEHYAQILKDHGIEIQEMFSTRIYQMVITVFSVYADTWNFGRTLTRKDALSLIQSHKQYSYGSRGYKISKDHTYLYPNEVRNLAHRLKFNIQYSTEYTTGDYINITDKHTHRDYQKWASEQPKDYWENLFKREEKIDENKT